MGGRSKCARPVQHAVHVFRIMSKNARSFKMTAGISPQQESIASLLMMDAVMADTRLSRVPGAIPSIPRTI